MDSLVITGSGGIVDLTGQAQSSFGSNLTRSTTANLIVNNPNHLAPTSFNVGDTFQLINWGGLVPTGTFTNLTVIAVGSTYSADFNDLPALGTGEYWNLANLYTQGTITVVVPEPGRLWLLLLGVLCMGWRRRRRGIR